MPGCCRPSNWATVVLPEAACSTPKSPVVLPGGWSVGPRNPCVLRALISLHAHAKRLLQATIPTDQACGVARVSAAPPAQLSTNGAEVLRWAFADSRVPVPCGVSAHGCRVNVSPPGGTLCRAVATYCTVLCRGSRHCYACQPCTNAWKETGYVLKENSKVNGPKF